MKKSKVSSFESRVGKKKSKVSSFESRVEKTTLLRIFFEPETRDFRLEAAVI